MGNKKRKGIFEIKNAILDREKGSKGQGLFETNFVDVFWRLEFRWNLRDPETISLLNLL